MKKILGLDLGVNSIGWAIIEENDETNGKILGMGSRIVPLDADDKNEFTSGKTISKNQSRTLKRTQRKGYDRYQLRRAYLIQTLKANHMLPEPTTSGLDKLSLWKLRSDAAEKEINLRELGRVLLHLNQKRGYKSSRKEENASKKDTDYVAEVKTRYQELLALNLTIGQFFYKEFSQDFHFRAKQRVYPREAYMQEYDRIMATQKKFHHELTDELIKKLRNEIIFYQRNLKSQKGLVSVCEFEGFMVRDKSSGKELFVGPRVAPRTSPIAQVCKIWESINNITLTNKKGDNLVITRDERIKLFNYLDNNEKISQAELYKILGLKKEDGWYGNKQISKGIQGNLTKTKIQECFKNPEAFQNLFEFNTEIVEKPDIEVYRYDQKSGEIIDNNSLKIISVEIEQQPLYVLWHTIYSSTDKNNCKDVLVRKFGIPEEAAGKLSSLDFSSPGFSNKSAKTIRKILPYLMEGYGYSDACMFAGYRHSDSITKAENQARTLLSRIPNLQKNSLRQPIVEKILNQMINVVNAILEEFGQPDEIRVELARELKQSKDERNSAYKDINQRERENTEIAKRLQDEYHIRPTRNNIIKYRLFTEIDGEDSKSNATCIYCGKSFGISAALSGSEVDVEHIIPKSLLFDDSQSNKTLTHRHCNEAKGNLTAFDYMKRKSAAEFEDYLERVDNLFKKGIIKKSKRDKLLMPADKIPKDFISRQLRETQYISRKSREILTLVCRDVWATSGSVTEYLRRIWGWNDVLMNLQIPKYRELGLTETITIGNDHQTSTKEIIPGWSKRDDHRHHAIDALTIACSRPGYIQRINTLSSEKTRDLMYNEIATKNYDTKKNLLENYIYSKRPFTTQQVEEVASSIIVSFKPGKRVASKSKFKATGKNLSSGVIVPRGPLSEENVYGKIKTTEKKSVKFLFENPGLIATPKIKLHIEERLAKYNNDSKKALASLRKDPIFLDPENKMELSYGSCYREEFVRKYPVETLKAKDIDSVVDGKIRQILKERLSKFSGNEKGAFNNLQENPIWLSKEKNIAVKTVRLFTGLKAAEPIKRNPDGEPIGFVKPGNNHHIAIYKDKDGNLVEHVCTFWHAVQRKKHGIPVIISDTSELWNQLLSRKLEFDDQFLNQLPNDGLCLHFSMQQNELFTLGLDRPILLELLCQKKFNELSRFIYRVQKITSGDYFFRHHLETKVDDKFINSTGEIIRNESLAKETGKLIRISSMPALVKQNPIAIHTNILGTVKLKNFG